MTGFVVERDLFNLFFDIIRRDLNFRSGAFARCPGFGRVNGNRQRSIASSAVGPSEVVMRIGTAYERPKDLYLEQRWGGQSEPMSLGREAS